MAQSSFFQSKKRFLITSSLTIASATVLVCFQNCSAAKPGSSSASASSGTVTAQGSDSVSKNMNGSAGSEDSPVGVVGGSGSISQFRGDDALVPGFTISKNEIQANQALSSDAVNKNVVCKLFARPVVTLGEAASFMIVMYDSSGRELFDSFKDGSGNTFKFPVAGLAHIDLVGQNQNANGVVGVRDRLSQESHRLGHAVYVVNDANLSGSYSRVAEVFNENGALVCRTNKVAVQVLAPNVAASRESRAECVTQDISSTADLKGKKLCPGFRILGADESNPNKVSVSDVLGSKESSAQATSRLLAAQLCQSGRALISRVKDAGDQSLLVENECLK